MPLNILFAVLSMLSTGISDFLYKRAQAHGADAKFFIVFQALLFNVCNLALFAFSGSYQIPIKTIILGAGCASLAYPAVYLFLTSLQEGRASTNVPIFRLSFVVTAIMAFVFLQEPATVGKLVAVGLAVLSILALSGSLRFETSSRVMLLQLVFSTIMYGSFGFLYKIAIAAGSSPMGILVAQGAFVLVASSIVASQGNVKDFFRRNQPAFRSVMVHAPICGVLLSFSWRMLLESLRLGDVSVGFSIVQLSFVVTSALSILIWNEKANTLKLLGIVAAVSAVCVFAYA